MAVLDIPAIGIRDMVVVQGTSAENMTLGPGHLRDTPMPGQAGVSEIFGRRATFGAPFARLDDLRPGDVIVTITGQGRSVYRVAALGSSQAVRIDDPAPNRLLLVTAASPVRARATTSRSTPGWSRSPGPGPRSCGCSTRRNWPWPATTGRWCSRSSGASRWPRCPRLAPTPRSAGHLWAAYLAAVPLAIAVLWNLYQSLSALLPNLY